MVTGILAVAFALATLMARWVLKEVPDSNDTTQDDNEK
jgi:hypothetical protein